MARPLQKQKQDGTRYVRTPAVEQEIDVAIAQGLQSQVRRARLMNRTAPDFLPMECLVYLIRDALRRDDDTAINKLLVPFHVRCEAILKRKVPDGYLPDSAGFREDVLSDLNLLLLEPDSLQLDFWECSFYGAFTAFLVDRLRREGKRVTPLETLPLAADAGASAEDDTVRRLRAELQSQATQQSELALTNLLEAIHALPPDERQAIVLCCLYDYKEESQDPAEITAATLCGVTGRTIRNRLKRARRNLGHIIEEK